MDYRDKLTKEYLEKHYVQELKTTKEIGDVVGCADWTVSCYLAKYNITRRTAGPKYNNIENQKFGELVTLEKDKTKRQHRGAYWVCLCSCGNVKSVSGSALVNKTITHCGSKKNHPIPCNKSHGHWKGGKYIPKTYISNISAAASNRGLEFNVTLTYLEKLYIQQNKKCALSGLDIGFASKDSDTASKTASLDRIDNTKGYIKGNVWWIHKDINKMKWAFDKDKFVEYCRKIAEFYKAPGTIE